MIARRLRITGKVQGVWYRDWAVRTARALGLTGWVRNRSDGSVEALAIGTAEGVERFVAACGEGSPRAEVAHVQIEDCEPEPILGFDKRATL